MSHLGVGRVWLYVCVCVHVHVFIRAVWFSQRGLGPSILNASPMLMLMFIIVKVAAGLCRSGGIEKTGDTQGYLRCGANRTRNSLSAAVSAHPTTSVSMLYVCVGVYLGAWSCTASRQ